MITMEELALQGQTKTKPIVMTPEALLQKMLTEPFASTSQPIAPVKSRRGFGFGGIVMIVVLAVGLTLGFTGNLGIAPLDVPAVTVPTTAPALVLPTAAIVVAPVAPVAPVIPTVARLPPGIYPNAAAADAAYKATAQATLNQAPVVAQPVPTTAPVVLNQAVDVPAPVAPAAPVVCTETNANYIVYRTVTSAGQPVAKLSAFSCVSLAEAESQADAKEKAIRDQIIANAAQANAPVVLDAPPPTPPMGQMHGGGGSW